jgi:hypothetical protein
MMSKVKDGVVRSGPYPTGIENGPDPITKRGKRRRARKEDRAGQTGGYVPSDYSGVTKSNTKRKHSKR